MRNVLVIVLGILAGAVLAGPAVLAQSQPARHAAPDGMTQHPHSMPGMEIPIR